MLVSNNYPPGVSDHTPGAPWNRPEAEPTFIVQEWVPPSARSPKGCWCRVHPAEYGVADTDDLDALLDQLRAATPGVKFELRRDDA